MDRATSFSDFTRASRLLVILLLLLAGCGGNGETTDPAEDSPAADTEQTEQATPGMANPASVHCDEQGGTEETREDANGDQYGVCVFPDGSECDSWAYFREECAPGEPPAT